MNNLWIRILFMVLFVLSSIHTLFAGNLSHKQYEDIVLRQSSLKQLVADLVWPYIDYTILPVSHQLGMGKVPVLDQGPHGTCATFSTTAAIDAYLEVGDYISQYCILQLSNNLAANGYRHSLWVSGNENEVLNIYNNFGIIPKDKESVCGIARGYDKVVGDSVDSVSLNTYHSSSERPRIITYKEIPTDIVIKALQDTKEAISTGHRVLLGIVLTSSYEANHGADSSYKALEDTWALVPTNVRNIALESTLTGHSVIITGYDDTAVVIDKSGQPHRGVFTLRNSWGKDSGDHGNYYVTYDYFRAFAITLYVVGK
jgi:hypothetical protein